MSLLVLLVTAVAVGAADWPAFHDGGPLLGVAEPIGAPPMKVRWTFRAADDPPPGDAAQQTGITPAFENSAAIVDGIVYAADKSGALRAIDLKTGKRKWTFRTEAGFSASPAVKNGVVYIGDEEGLFCAVSANTGQQLWKFDGGSSIHSSANFSGEKIIFGDDGADIYCLSVGGKKIWEVKSGDRVNGSPAIAATGAGGPTCAFVSGCDAELRAIGVADGKPQFEKEMGALCPGSPAILEGRIIVGTDGGKVICLSTDGQKQFWEFTGVGNQAMVYSSPAVADGIVVFGARDRNVYGVDLASGQKKWSFATRGDVDSSPVISGGRVYIGSKDKRFYVLDLKTGEKQWDFVASRGITATPAIAQGAVVIGDTAGMLYCFEPGHS